MLTPRPLRVAVLFSHRAPGLRALAAHPLRGRRFELVAALTSEVADASYHALAEAAGVPLLSHPLREKHRSLAAPLADRRARRLYDAATEEMLLSYAPDLVLLASYLYVLTEPMLEAYEGRILNVHHADLCRVDVHGRPLYPGLRAVRDAILAGEPETRATLHVVSPELDAGPPLARSWAFPVSPLAAAAREWGARDVLSAYAFAHQEWMIRSAWGPLLCEGVTRFMAGTVEPPLASARPILVDLPPPGHRHTPVPRAVPTSPSWLMEARQ
jgi:folate-dependent phosphoribosylglycinamide formyltransferase PurN